MNQPPTTLIFVYNADSGVFNLLNDMAHKIFSPQTYACNLCALTHTNFGMKKEWREFLAGLGKELEFLHADEFNSRYEIEKTKFPAIFQRENGALTLIAGADVINGCRTLEDLKKLFE